MGLHLVRPFVVWVGQSSQRQAGGEVSAAGPGGGSRWVGAQTCPPLTPCRNDGKSHLVGGPESVKKGCADTLSIGGSCCHDHMPAGVRELSQQPASIVGG